MTFNKKLALTSVSIAVVVLLRLAFTAQSSGNWRGFAYSSMHLLIVATVSYFLLKDCSLEQCQDLAERQQNSLDS